MVSLVERAKFPIYMVGTVFVIGSYLLLGLGVYIVDPRYVHWVSVVFHILVCLFLLIRFNPFTPPVLRAYDTNIIFGTVGLLLLNILAVNFGIHQLPKEVTMA